MNLPAIPRPSLPGSADSPPWLLSIAALLLLVLYQAVLRQSTSTRLRAKQLWLSLGAGANVDVLIDGKPTDVPSGTVELVLPSKAPTA